ncbi:autotransporter outer membrane beta-barrel domain-containing protein [Bosea sp. MMO-172]|uniref:autotransporter outer membrane beta-barrel domain-containing protein n=1 Tax=Bosea sp. MMO-172 TaxID=3127885 RepID=UPI003016747F
MRGTYGAGAAGISGSDLSITNTGTIAGGLSGDGLTRAAAIHITGGSNSLSFGNATSGLNGGIVVAAGSLTFAQPTNVTVDNAISGAGQVTKSGAGTLILTGINTYSGGTSLTGGRLAVSSNANLGAVSGGLTFNGGTLQALGSFTTARATNLASAGTVEVVSGETLTMSGSISGTGGLSKTGTGTLALTGNSSAYGAGTTVSAGKLVVNGQMTNSVMTLDSGGALGGVGRVGGIVANAGATVMPGNSIGTLNVSGNVSFAAGSTYQVEINAGGQNDRIAASGTATLSGGTVQVLAANGTYAANQSYTILTATGGVSGQFAAATSNLAFLTPSLSYGSQNVVLTMTRNDNSFASITATRNQGFIAAAAERLGADNPIHKALVAETAGGARAGFNLLSGEAHAHVAGVMVNEGGLLREAILGHLRNPLSAPVPGQVAAGFSADRPGRDDAIMMPAPMPQPRYTLWGAAFGGAGNRDGDGNAGSLSQRSGGALFGADLMVHDAPGSSLKLGAAGGYSQSRFDHDTLLSSGRLESGHAALYASARFGGFRLDAGAAYSWSESDIRRQVMIRGFGDQLRLQRAGSTLQGFAELGYGFTFGGLALEPFAQLALIRVSTETGTESGGAAALHIFGRDQSLGFATLGLRAEAQIGAMPLFARAMVGWRHGFGALTPEAGTAFVAGTTPARVFAAPIDRDALAAEAGLDWRVSHATTFGLTYSASLGERSRDHALKGRVEMRF